MNLSEIQHVIETLPPEEQASLPAWLPERDRAQWDAGIERDFSPGGIGMALLTEVKERVRGGQSSLMDKRSPVR